MYTNMNKDKITTVWAMQIFADGGRVTKRLFQERSAALSYMRSLANSMYEDDDEMPDSYERFRDYYDDGVVATCRLGYRRELSVTPMRVY